jgi:OOP family OmpA-OmpF porin
MKRLPYYNQRKSTMAEAKLKKALAILGLASTMMVAGPAFAQDQGWYIGATLGQSKAKDGCTDVIGSCDDKDSAWRILGGYQFNKNLAVELGYTDLGEVSGDEPGFGPFSVETTVFELVAVGSWPFANNFAAYGKLGMYRGDPDASGGGFSLSESNTDMTYGVGLRLRSARGPFLRIELGWGGEGTQVHVVFGDREQPPLRGPVRGHWES